MQASGYVAATLRLPVPLMRQPKEMTVMPGVKPAGLMGVGVSHHATPLLKRYPLSLQLAPSATLPEGYTLLQERN